MLPRAAIPPKQARAKNTPYYPMQVLNGLVQSKLDRQAPSCDYDETPIQFRRYIGTGSQDVQIYNGLRNKIAAGWRFVFPGSGYLDVVMPQIPGQTRGNYGGFIPRGPSPWNVNDLYQQGPGSQPAHPGGPGKIASAQFYNPMTG